MLNWLTKFWGEVGLVSGEGTGNQLQYSCLEKSHVQRTLVGCSPWGRKELDTTEWLHFHFSLSCIGEGNGNPLQYSCRENPRDGGALWAAVYGVAQSQTWLKWLSSSSSSSSRPSLKLSPPRYYLFSKKESNYNGKFSRHPPSQVLKSNITGD